MPIALAAASLQGSYAFAVMGDGGQAPFGAMGLLRFDGRDAVSGSFTENRRADQSGARVLVNVRYQASYAVTPEGLGSITLPNQKQADLRFVVQVARPVDDGSLALELAFVFRTEDESTGCLRSGFAVRRPDEAAFDHRSLRGRFVGLAVGRGGPTPISGVGVNSYDGESAFLEANVATVHGSGGRVFADGSDRGVFTVNPDGTGTVAGGQVLSIITRARVSEGIALAEEYWFMMRNLTPSGAHFTGVMRRLSD